MAQNGFSLKVVIPFLILVTIAFFVAFGAVIGGLFWQWDQVDQAFEPDAAVAEPVENDTAPPTIAPPLD